MSCKVKFAFIVMVSALLTSCSTPQEEAKQAREEQYRQKQAQQANSKRLNAKCIGYGFQRGTTAFAQCIQQVEQQEATSQALEQCFNQARRREQSCALIAYGGVSSIGNPVVRERQQVCKDRQMSAEEHCLRMHKPSALEGVPARVPIPQRAQPQQIIIQNQAQLPVLPNAGPIIPGPTPYGR